MELHILRREENIVGTVEIVGIVAVCAGDVCRMRECVPEKEGIQAPATQLQRSKARTKGQKATWGSS